MAAVYADGSNNEHPNPEHKVQQAPEHITALAVLIDTLACNDDDDDDDDDDVAVAVLHLNSICLTIGWILYNALPSQGISLPC